VVAVDPLDPEAGARVEVRTDSDGLYALMAYLDERDVTLSAVRTVDPDLTDVVVDLTTGGTDR
jgi:ABC-2 type transport system ATP-binding protein